MNAESSSSVVDDDRVNSSMNKLREWIDTVATGQDMMLETPSPAFNRWFAGSKIVDAKGDPLVVYHGTSKKFRKFDTTRGRTEAAFFTDSKIAASGYGTPVEFYLRMVNPAIYDFRNQYWNSYNRPKGEWALYKDGVMVEKKGYFDSEIQAEWDADEGEVPDHAPEAETTNSLADTAREQGHDGCIFKRVKDNSDQHDFDEPHTVYVVFSADQIRRVPRS